MKKKKSDQPMIQDDALFEALKKKKKRRRRKILITVAIIIVVILAALIIGVSFLRRQVQERFAVSTEEVQSYAASVGSISTTVSGSGQLTDVDLESMTIPASVTIDELKVRRNDSVAVGDIIATVDMTSVTTAMATIQDEISTIDEEIADASADEVSSYVKAGVSGRVKKIYAQADMKISDCMYEYGAIALISLDGYMAVDLETTALSEGDAVTVVASDGTKFSGSVGKVSTTTATILVTDNGTVYEDTVSVVLEDGTTVGSGSLYIHNPLRVTGFAGTVSYVNVSENQKVYTSTTIVTLSDTEYSSNYETLLEERQAKEDVMLELLQIYKDGAVLATMDGSVNSVDYEQGTAYTTEIPLVTISPDESMSVTISVDEMDILSLELGQQVTVSVGSLDDATFMGTLTEIDKTATSSSGVTTYSAVITLDKDAQMLPGMTADVAVRIEGVDNAIIIPIEALHQTSTSAFVYTQYDEETKEYSGMVEVTVGISNSSYVEITSGLNEGDTVYYTESGTDSIFGGMDFGNMGGFGGDFGGGMPGGDFGGFSGDFGGEMPSGGDFGGFGGEMPSGGGFSGGMPGGGGMPNFGGMGQ